MTAIMKEEPKEATLPPAKQKESPGERAAALKAIADKKGISNSRLCIAWVSALGPHVIPLPGYSCVI